MESLWTLLGAAAAGSALLVALHLWRHRWWPQLRGLPWVRARLLREDRPGGACCCWLPPLPANLLRQAVEAVETATAPHVPATGLPLTGSGSLRQQYSGRGASSGSGRGGSSEREGTPAQRQQHAGAADGGSGEGHNAAAQQRRDGEERRLSAYAALPAQLQGQAVGEVARNYERLTSAQSFVITRLLRRVQLRSYD